VVGVVTKIEKEKNTLYLAVPQTCSMVNKPWLQNMAAFFSAVWLSLVLLLPAVAPQSLPLLVAPCPPYTRVARPLRVHAPQTRGCCRQSRRCRRLPVARTCGETHPPSRLARPGVFPIA
jgi:hypothetical protein